MLMVITWLDCPTKVFLWTGGCHPSQNIKKTLRIYRIAGMSDAATQGWLPPTQHFLTLSPPFTTQEQYIFNHKCFTTSGTTPIRGVAPTLVKIIGCLSSPYRKLHKDTGKQLLKQALGAVVPSQTRKP